MYILGLLTHSGIQRLLNSAKGLLLTHSGIQRLLKAQWRKLFSWLPTQPWPFLSLKSIHSGNTNHLICSLHWVPDSKSFTLWCITFSFLFRSRIRGTERLSNSVGNTALIKFGSGVRSLENLVLESMPPTASWEMHFFPNWNILTYNVILGLGVQHNALISVYIVKKSPQ